MTLPTADDLAKAMYDAKSIDINPPQSTAIVQALSDNTIQLSYTWGEKRFFAILTLDEAMTHSMNIREMVKALRKRAKIDARKVKEQLRVKGV